MQAERAKRDSEPAKGCAGIFKGGWFRGWLRQPRRLLPLSSRIFWGVESRPCESVRRSGPPQSSQRLSGVTNPWRRSPLGALTRRENDADELVGDIGRQGAVRIRKRRPAGGNRLPVLRQVALAVGTERQVPLEREAVGPRQFARQVVQDERRELATRHGCLSQPEQMTTPL